MSVLARPAAAAVAAKAFQGAVLFSQRVGKFKTHRFEAYPADASELIVPTEIAPARITVYRPATSESAPPVHVNFHGGGFVLPITELDDPMCRYLAARAEAVIVNVDYVLAPKHRFPAAPRQAFEVVKWVAEHGAEHGWDSGRLSVGGQSAGGSLAAAVARQAHESGGPKIALQVLHYPCLDFVTARPTIQPSPAKPALPKWMMELFENAYTPDPRVRADRLASPAGPADTADLTGIAPALILTAEFDPLRAEGERYAERLRTVGALAGLVDVAGADHGYDVHDGSKALETYAIIARHLRQAVKQPQ
jgi:acetyl esterase/lipase